MAPASPDQPLELMFVADNASRSQAPELGLCNRLVPSGDRSDTAPAGGLRSEPSMADMLTNPSTTQAVELDAATVDGPQDGASSPERLGPVRRGF